jgi:hypothetical protein
VVGIRLVHVFAGADATDIPIPMSTIPASSARDTALNGHLTQMKVNVVLVLVLVLV